MGRVAGNSKYVKNLNRMTVLNIIKESEPVSRKQLAKLTGLTPPAITGIVRELIDMGLVMEVGLEKSRGGRRPVKLRFNPNAGYIIGVEVTRYETKIGLADLKNYPKNIQTIEIDMTEPKVGIPKLIEVVNKTIAEGSSMGKNFLGLAVAFPGLINIKDGSIKRSVNLGPQWSSFPVRRALEEGLGFPVFIENNSNASALGEQWFGIGKDYRDLVYINLGEGISAGIILNNRVLHGFQGHAGEIGHIVMQEGGPLCNCGNRGCLESICGIPALLRNIKTELPLIKKDDPLKKIWDNKGKLKIEDLMSSATIKDSYSHELFKQISIYISKAIADIINFYNPEAVFIGGKMASVFEMFLGDIRNIVNSHAFPEIAVSTELKISSLGESSGVVGACALALRQLFKSNSDMLSDVQQYLDSRQG